MMVPLQSIIIPEYVNLAKFNLTSNYTGAVLVYAALGAPFATFLMATYYRGISDELIEAAVMDGLSYERTFLRIALPLSLPAIATVTVLQFIQIWDDLLVGYLFLPTNDRTITVGLAVLSSGRTTGHPAADGRVAAQRHPGDHRLPDLPALPDQGPDPGHGQVTGAGADLGGRRPRPASSSASGRSGTRAPSCLIWVDISAGHLHQFTVLTSPGETLLTASIATAGVPVGAAAPRAGGGYVLAAADGFRLIDADGAADGAAGAPAGHARRTCGSTTARAIRPAGSGRAPRRPTARPGPARSTGSTRTAR